VAFVHMPSITKEITYFKIVISLYNCVIPMFCSVTPCSYNLDFVIPFNPSLPFNKWRYFFTSCLPRPLASFPTVLRKYVKERVRLLLVWIDTKLTSIVYMIDFGPRRIL